jgi:hypothetical protein
MRTAELAVIADSLAALHRASLAALDARLTRLDAASAALLEN